MNQVPSRIQQRGKGTQMNLCPGRIALEVVVNESMPHGRGVFDDSMSLQGVFDGSTSGKGKFAGRFTAKVGAAALVPDLCRTTFNA